MDPDRLTFGRVTNAMLSAFKLDRIKVKKSTFIAAWDVSTPWVKLIVPDGKMAPLTNLCPSESTAPQEVSKFQGMVFKDAVLSRINHGWYGLDWNHTGKGKTE